MTTHTYICSSCGKEHHGLPTDWAFKLPDDVFELSYLDRYRRTRANGDLCTLDHERFFIRGLLSMPFAYQEGGFAWGVWIEVDAATHDFYLDNFNDEFAQGVTAKGRLANVIPGYPDQAGTPMELEFQDATSRPLLRFPLTATHRLALDQRDGIDFARHHEYLELCGHFSGSDA